MERARGRPRDAYGKRRPGGSPTYSNPACPTCTIPDANSLAAATTGSLSAGTSNFIGGVQLGYNNQVSSAFVLGVEADIAGLAGSKGSGASSSSALVVGWPGQT